jgi:TorA maturation chaperone TorD
LMNDSMTLDDALELLESRAGVYTFLSAVYGVEVNKDVLAELREQLSGESEEEEDAGYALMRRFFEETSEEEASAVETELAADYASLFLSMGRKPVPPYESVFTSEERLVMQRARDEVLALYREEGLGRVEGFREPEDHIAIEMEFMGYLCQKAMESLEGDDTEEARAYLQKQKDFLEKHLMVWVPQFCRDVQEVARTDFYKAIAQITEEHLSYEGDAIAELMEAI